MKVKSDLKAVDFFCSGGGMSFGMKKAGVEVLAGVDFDLDCKKTYETNIGAKFIHADIETLTYKRFEEESGIKKNDDSLIMIGCSPCQFWSIIRTDKSKAKKSKNLLHEFHRFVKRYNPGYVVVENVPGLMKKDKESGLDRFVNSLKEQGYEVEYDIHNVHDYGVPQSRKRFTLIADRVNKNLIKPKKVRKQVFVKDFIGEHKGFPKLEAGARDTTTKMHVVAGLSDLNLQRLALTPKNGGSRNAWADTPLQLEAYKRGTNVSFGDTYGRMSWDKPAPTITTKFYSISNGRFAHPEEDRAISIREGATLQTFPKSYKFIGGSIGPTARMIGNAVPPAYARKIGEAIINHHYERRRENS